MEKKTEGVLSWSTADVYLLRTTGFIHTCHAHRAFVVTVWQHLSSVWQNLFYISQQTWIWCHIVEQSTVMVSLGKRRCLTADRKPLSMMQLLVCKYNRKWVHVTPLQLMAYPIFYHKQWFNKVSKSDYSLVCSSYVPTCPPSFPLSSFLSFFSSFLPSFQDFLGQMFCTLGEIVGSPASRLEKPLGWVQLSVNFSTA